jgi:hypothetical protein
MKRYAPWLLVAFVLALLLTLGSCANRPTRVFLDSPTGRASCLYVSRLLVPAVAVMFPAVKPGTFWLHLEAKRSRAGPDESLPLRSSFSFDHALLRADDTGPPWIDLCGPQRWFERLRGGSGKARRRTQRGELSSEPAKIGTPAKIRVLQRVIFTTGYS